MAANRANIGWYLDNQIGGEDDRFTGRVYDKKVKLTAAQIIAMDTPIELVAAPGVGRAIEFISAVYFLDHGGTNFDSGGDTVIRTVGGAAVSDPVPAANLIEAAADATAVVRYGGGIAIVVNAGLEIANAGAAHANGNGTLTVKVMYRIHDFN